MPETAAVGDAYQLIIKGHLEGQETFNVLHFVCVGAEVDVDLNLVKKLMDCFILHLLPVMSAQYSFDGIAWKRVSPTLGPEFFTVSTGASVGTEAGDCEASFVSALFSIRTSLGGRSGRGRMYLPAVPESAATGSKIDQDGPFWLGLIAFAACVISAFVHPDPAGGSSLWNMSVYSRKLGGIHFPYGAVGFHPVKSLTPSAFLATTRSRKIGHGD